MESNCRARGIPQEALKGFACLCMLLDHIGVALAPNPWLRIVGRLAFPIYCYLLVEGFHRTRNIYTYMDRMLLCALLSELPFDYALFGGVTFRHQSVMLTLLLGLLAMEVMGHVPHFWGKLLAVIPILCAAEFIFHTDYGAWGVALIALLELTYPRKWLQLLGIVVLCAAMPSAIYNVFGVRISVETFGGLAVLPIALYSGRRVSGSAPLKWAFYLFYPVHLAVLWLLR